MWEFQCRESAEPGRREINRTSFQCQFNNPKPVRRQLFVVVDKADVVRRRCSDPRIVRADFPG